MKSEVIARKRRLSCFCGWQDRLLRNRALRERSCFFLRNCEALLKMRRRPQMNADIPKVYCNRTCPKRMGEILIICVLYFIRASAVLVWSTMSDDVTQEDPV
jgi:hypothetical protein